MAGPRGQKKKHIIAELFERLHRQAERVDIIPFNNDLVRELCIQRGFSSQFDATKFDSRKKLPDVMQEQGWFILHLGGGNHAFVRGEGYHDLEPLQESKNISGRWSILDTLGVSEASAVSTMYNEGIIQDFLLGRRDAPLMIHSSRRSKFSFSFRVGKHDLKANQLQMETDAFFEGDRLIAAAEVKHGRQKDFEIRQLFTPMRYFESFRRARRIPQDCSVLLLYVNRFRGREGQDQFKVYEYEFTDPLNFNSIRLKRAVGYHLTGRIEPSPRGHE